MEFVWDGVDGNKGHPVVDRAMMARLHIHSGLNCLLVKDSANSR